MAKKIFKFGGTSLATPDHIGHVYSIIEKAQKNDRLLGVVCSAFGGVTDQLLEMAALAAACNRDYLKILSGIEKRHMDAVNALVRVKDRKPVEHQVRNMLDELRDTLHGVNLVKENSPKTMDFIASIGERLSCCIITAGLKSRGVNADFLDTRSVLKTDHEYGSARVDMETSYKNIGQYFKDHKALQIITGFIGSTPDNETTTLGRGGSDYTASIFGAALKADIVEIWTDVNGVMTADPRKVKKAFAIDSMTFEEAMEMSHFGAKVIHPPTMKPAASLDIPIRIRNTFAPEHPGTLIQRRSSSKNPVRGISSIDDIALLRIQGSGMIGVTGISSRLFRALADRNISVILITQASSEHSICVAVPPARAAEAKKAIEEAFRLEIMARQVDEVIVERQLSIIAVVGENMQKVTGISGRCFDALGKNGINVIAIAQGSSERNISVVINRENEAKALNALHETFFLSETQSINVFLLGTGLIGGTLMQQIRDHAPSLLKRMSLDIRVVALGDIHKMIFQEAGIPVSRWQKILNDSGEPMDLVRFVHTMIGMNLPNTIFVECTGIEEIVSHYEEILNASISIVTPNKIANSGPYARYARLKETAARKGVKFLYETNVGAGLPVISTLNDLMASGDRILKIEAVLSGTLSFIFNTLSGDRPFSSIVREARQKGLSEPDPRDDLGGLDVLRKILILARETGLKLEPRDIRLESLLPQACIRAKSIDAFFTALEAADTRFETARRNAAGKGCKLRYMAVLEDGQARISMQEVDPGHPFYTLSGSDNMIVFTTERYSERPLVIKGPGAGKDVTAAGVFADIIRIASYLI